MKNIEQIMKIISQLNMDMEYAPPKVGTSLLSPTKDGDKYKVQIYITLHDVLDNPIRWRKTISINEQIESRARKKQVEIENRAIKAVKLAFDNGNKHDFLEEMNNWIQSLKDRIRSKNKKNLEISTYDSYLDRFKYYKPYFEKYPVNLEDMNQKTIEDFRDYLLDYGRFHPLYNKETGEVNYGLSSRSVKDILSIMYTFFEQQRIIYWNPCKKVTVDIHDDNSKDLTVARWMELDVYEKLKKWLINESDSYQYKHFHKYIDICELAIQTGMRRSELLGLHWDKISFEQKTLRIAQTRVRSTSGVEDKNRVKTKSSYRVYIMTDPMIECLKGIKQRQITKGIYDPCGFVFLWEDKDDIQFGKPYAPDYITKTYKKLMKACPYTKDEWHFHLLRHSCCSILRSLGWSEEEASAWLGHGGIEITREVYDHYEEKINENSHKSLNDAFA